MMRCSNLSRGSIVMRHAFALQCGRQRVSTRPRTVSCSAQISGEPEAFAAKKGGRQAAKIQPSSSDASHQQKINLNSLPGTKDHFPEDMRARQWLFGLWERISEQYGFEMVEGPVLEAEELFTRKAGEEIVDQLYNFQDKGGRRVALRPELTPSLARLVLQKGKGLILPAKWSQIGQCWRYERATRGRRRVHWQWNLDIIGVPGVEAEAELLAAMVAFFRATGLGPSDVGIKISSRKVMQQVLQRHTVPDDSFSAVCVVVDKLDKIGHDKVKEELNGLGVSPDAIAAIFEVVALSDVDDLPGLLGADNETAKELQQLFKLLEGYGCGEWLQFDASIMRGLAYYTGVVFEAFDRSGELRAIAGGGRYDRLLSTLGGDPQPCAGFGFGDAVIFELLAERSLLPEVPHKVDDVVIVMDETLRREACQVAGQLREGGRRVDLVLQPKKMKWVFKHAARCTAARLVILGPEEWSRGVVRVKDLESRTETDMPVADLC